MSRPGVLQLLPRAQAFRLPHADLWRRVELLQEAGSLKLLKVDGSGWNPTALNRLNSLHHEVTAFPSMNALILRHKIKSVIYGIFECSLSDRDTRGG